MVIEPFANAASRDETRPVATEPDHDYSLTVEEAADRYAAAGHPRTLRTVQRYCAKGHLDCHKVETAIGDKYLVAPYSVARHIAQINEVIAFTTSRDRSRPTTAVVAAPLQAIPAIRNATGASDTSRPDAADRAADEHESSLRRATRKRERISTRSNQIKDTQIGELSERARETNVLIKGLQDLFLRLQPGRAEAARIHAQPSDRLRIDDRRSLSQ